MVDLKPAGVGITGMHHTLALACVGITFGIEGEGAHSSEVHASTILTELARIFPYHILNLQSN